jgi:hypothetical protein
MEANLSQNYERFINKISKDINQGKIKTRVIAPKVTYLRAAGLRKHFNVDSWNLRNLGFMEPVYISKIDSIKVNQKLGSRTLRPFETITALSAQSTVFQISPISNVDGPEDWRLVVKDRKDREVKSFTGNGKPQTEIRWDWKDSRGDLVNPGIYSYQLEWFKDSKREITPKKYITVKKLLRHIKIEISNEQKDIGDDTDEIDIILKK